MKRVGKKPITATRTTPSSSPRSSITTTTNTFTFMEQDRSDSSCYFPGCKKDANCTCRICIDSINATLDLMPLTSQKKTSLANLNPVRPSPIPFNSSSLISTPKIGERRRRNQWSPIPTPCWKSTARIRPKAAAEPEAEVEVSEVEDVGRRKRSRSGGLILIFVLLIFGMELGLPLIISRAFRTELSAEIVKELGERAFAVEGMNRKLRMLQSELQVSVNTKISNCTHNPRAWKTSQDGLLASSRCVLYKSTAEEVSVWGWPLQTAGLLASRFSSKSFTVLSGRVTQWSEGNAGYVTVKARESWVQDKFTAYAVQMDAQTWVIEYRRTMLLEHNGLCSAMWKILEYNLPRFNVGKMRVALRWVSEMLGGYSAAGGAYDHLHPT